MIKEFVIDLFCGAGGTSTGVHLANCTTTVAACVNHDIKAVESHRMNHPKAKHFIEDIRNPEVVFLLKLRVNALRKLYPNCIITIWASLECTNFSKAKGGLPRDADSRTLAEHLFMYLESLNPDYLMIENVMEFMSWGPLDKNGRPVSIKRGTDYLRWVENVKGYGYNFDWKELNAADFGAYTSRRRYFAQFAKGELPISWPEQTHCKNPDKETDLSRKPLKKWKAVKEVLNFENVGKSIFLRKKPLVENTLKRIYAGLIKFVADGDESFLLKYNSTSKSGKHSPPGVNDPCPTVATQNRLGIIKMEFLQSYYGNGNAHSISQPCPTVSTKDRFAKVGMHFIEQQYGNSTPKEVTAPLNTITNNPKFALVSTKPWSHHYILNPQFGNVGNSIEKPCPTVIARQDKKPLGIISCETGSGLSIVVYPEDTPTMIKIKKFMAHFGIIDIKMRMLEVNELLQIQGFPKNYVLTGTQTDKKKFIGNSVEVTTAKKLFESHYKSLLQFFEDKVAA